MRQINLLPDNLKNKEKLRFLKKSLLCTVGVSLLVMVLVHFILILRVGSLEKALSNPAIYGGSEVIKKLQKDIDIVIKDTRRDMKRSQYFAELLDKNLMFSSVLQNISNIASDKVWFKRVKIVVDGKNFEIEGKSFNTRLVSEFMLDLRKLAYFKNVDLITMEKNDDGVKKEIDFKIACKLK